MRVEDLLGRTIAGYRLREILGKGGMSIVFMGERQEDAQDKAAIKILLPADVSTAGEFAAFQTRFLREAQAVHRLNYAHILPVLDYGEEDGLFYMVMPLLTGGTLTRRLAEAHGSLPLPEIEKELNQLAEAVDYAHQHGMIHRDIKPGNVLTDAEGNVYLADFGIVRLFDTGHQTFDLTLTTLTTTGKIYGTPAYMAPERYKGEPAEPATDIYSLGILLYQLVTGQVPFEADNALALGLKHLNEQPPAPRVLRPELPEPAEQAILKAIAKQPSERFATASALALAFSAGLRNEWTEELLPLPVALAAAAEEETIRQPVAAAVAALADEATRPEPIALAAAPVGENLPIELAPTAIQTPAVARAEPRFWKNLQVFSLAMLGVAILLLAGLLAFAAYKFVTPGGPTPNIHILSPGATGQPTKTHLTPASSAGTTPAAGHTATPGITPSAGSTPTPTTPPAPGNTPTAPPPPQPTPTPSPTSAPQPSPTAQGTP